MGTLRIKFCRRAAAWALALLMLGTALPLLTLPAAAKEELSASYSFDKLSFGEVEASDIGAVEESNMKFGVDNVRLLSARNGYEEAYATWKLDGGTETFDSFAFRFTGRTYYVSEEQKNNNSMKVSVSADGTNFTLVKEYRSNANADMGQQFALDLSEYLAGQSTAYVRMSFLVFDSPHIMGLKSVELIANGSVEVEKDPEPVVTDKTPEQCRLVTQFHAFNQLAFGEVTPEEIGAVSAQNMKYGVDEVPLLSARNGYEPAFATWMIEAADGEPLNDLVLTLVGRIWYMDPAQKDKSTLKLLVSLDNHNFDLVETLYPTEEANDAQKLTYDLTEYVKGYGRAYVQLQFLVFDSPHTIGFRSVTLTANTAGISDDTGSSRMPVSNVQSFTSLPVGAASAEALGAEKSANLTFGLNRVPLLTARESGEDAYGIWKITAAEGETFDDAHLTLIGKTGFVNADKKDTSFLKVTVSTDGESYSEVQTFTATEETSDTQKLSMDLTNFVYGANQIYVKLYFSSEDDPTAFGLRSLTLVGNAGEDYDDFTPAVEDVVIPEGRATTVPSGTQGTASGTTAGDGPSAPAGFPWWGIVLIVIAVLGAAGTAVWLVLKRKKAAPTQK